MDDILITGTIVATADGWLDAVNLLIQNGHIAATGGAQSKELSHAARIVSTGSAPSSSMATAAIRGE